MVAYVTLQPRNYLQNHPSILSLRCDHDVRKNKQTHFRVHNISMDGNDTWYQEVLD